MPSRTVLPSTASTVMVRPRCGARMLSPGLRLRTSMGFLHEKAGGRVNVASPKSPRRLLRPHETEAWPARIAHGQKQDQQDERDDGLSRLAVPQQGGHG